MIDRQIIMGRHDDEL
ncbi:hypothetical protein BBL03_RS25800 [Escherichia coli]